MGVVLRTVYDKLKAEGAANLHFLANRDMLGTDGEGTVDGCHPSDLGMMRMADAFAKKLASIVQESRPQTTNYRLPATAPARTEHRRVAGDYRRGGAWERVNAERGNE
jgi:hypothetical protein